MAYVVEIKPSARRRNAAAGEHVCSTGSRRSFPGRTAADAWARELSASGAAVYVRDANPADAAPVDGYLLAPGGKRDRRGRVDDHVGPEGEPGPGRQAELPPTDGGHPP